MSPSIDQFSGLPQAASESAIRVVIEEIKDACRGAYVPVPPLDVAIQHVVPRVNASQVILEFGVDSGRTVGVLGKAFQDRIVYGFDSFEGLPEDWRPGLFDKGAFGRDSLPGGLPMNVQLVKGWFEETLPPFRRHFLLDRTVGLLHVDCDLYSSTRTVLSGLNDQIVPGTVMVFDELINYPGYEDHEIRALAEWVADYGRGVAVLATLARDPDQFRRLPPGVAEDGLMQSVAMMVVR
jgi:hypothetical protein